MAQVNAGRVRFVSRGEYNNSTQYYTLDLVNYDGSSYYAKENVVGVLPTDNTKWQLVAEKGSIGSTGPTGPSGFSPSASVTQLQNGALISITDENGTTTANISNGEVTNKEFEYYKTISNVLPKVEDEDTEITLNNTGNAPLSIGLKGNTYQDSTTGKNLWKPIPSATKNGMTLTNNNDGSYTLNGTTTATTSFYLLNVGYGAGTYTLSANNSATLNGSSYLQLETSGGNKRMAMVNVNSTGTFECDNINVLTIVIGNGTNCNNFVIKPQLELGSEATSYEQYTGGNPAPNPDYPQDIHVVSGDNTITISNIDNTQEQVYPINLGNIELCKTTDGKYEDDIRKTTGKNLFDKNDNNIRNNQRLDQNGQHTNDNGYYVTQFIKIDANTTYTKNSPTADAYHRVCFYTSNDQATYISRSENNTFTTPSNAQYLRFCGIMEELDTAMLEKSPTSTYWEPYGKKWIKYGAIGKVVLDGSENILYNESGNWNFRYAPTPAIYSTSSSDYTKVICNYFKAKTAGTDLAITDYDNKICFRYDACKTGSSADFKNWLSTHNTEVRYVLATPEITEITDSNLISQLDDIEYAMSYKGQTNISQENNDMPFIINASAFKDLSNL